MGTIIIIYRLDATKNYNITFVYSYGLYAYLYSKLEDYLDVTFFRKPKTVYIACRVRISPSDENYLVIPFSVTSRDYNTTTSAPAFYRLGVNTRYILYRRRTTVFHDRDV